MRVKWLGHAAFLVTANDGTRIVTDPYGDYASLSYKPIQEEADIVVVSHDHGDHVGGKVKGNPKKVTGAGSKKVGGIEFRGLDTYHDTSKGKERGRNTVFRFNVDGVRICHLGDLGHELAQSEVNEIGPVDVLMIPVGGLYTIDAATATKISEQLKPKVTIPMHYKTDKCTLPISGVDEFLKGKSGIRKLDSSEIEVKAGSLPQTAEIVVLKHAM
jgi:L-ascorbate metabolism protein UlaG (beta-lactamase superfamily)